MSTIFIARHGNTFDKGDTILRVGKRTDLPLSNSGLIQAEKLGALFLQQNINLDYAFCSTLQRTKQTAAIILEASKQQCQLVAQDIFDEIDYGIDDGKPETEVISRLGKAAIEKWDKQAIVPNGWQVDVARIIQNWQNFGEIAIDKYFNKNILITTSNGIARFAPYLTKNFAEFCKKYQIKLPTGGLGCLKAYNGSWQVKFWGI